MIRRTSYIDSVHIWTQENGKMVDTKNYESNSQFLYKWSEFMLRESKKMLKPTWNELDNNEQWFGDSLHLRQVERVLNETCDTLLTLITYKPHRNQLKKIQQDLHCEKDEDKWFSTLWLVSMCVEGDIWQYDSKYDKDWDKDLSPAESYAIIARYFRKHVKTLRKIMDDNEIAFIYR